MPSIAVTMGDPSGIGPEIVLKSLIRNPELRQQVIVVGNTGALERAASGMHIEEIPDDIKVSDVDGPLSPIGKTGPESGNIAIKSIEIASEMALNSDVIGICTAPINKESIKMAGSSFIDHTDMLKSLTGSEWISTVFESGNLRIFFLTKHLSLMKAFKSLNIEMIEQGLEEAQISMNLIGIERPRIAVAAINPHAGENGILGIEEREHHHPCNRKDEEQDQCGGPISCRFSLLQGIKGGVRSRCFTIP
jgi:Pyridoxal phosphate biosynthesis protein